MKFFKSTRLFIVAVILLVLISILVFTYLKQKPTNRETDILVENSRVLVRWVRSGGIVGYCDLLTIDENVLYGSNEKLVTAVRTDRCKNSGKGIRLSDQMKQKLIEYIETYKPFTIETSDQPDVIDGIETKLVFNGQGKLDVDDGIKKSINDLITTLLIQNN